MFSALSIQVRKSKAFGLCRDYKQNKTMMNSQTLGFPNHETKSKPLGLYRDYTQKGPKGNYDELPKHLAFSKHA